MDKTANIGVGVGKAFVHARADPENAANVPGAAQSSQYLKGAQFIKSVHDSSSMTRA